MKFVINNPKGHFDISNKIYLQGAKNSMLQNVCLPLLTKEECIIENVPKIRDIELSLIFLKRIGAKVEWINESTISITCQNITNKLLPPDFSRKTTGSKFFIPLMVSLFGEYKTGPCGGCDIGDRQFDKHAKALEPFGIFHKKLDADIYHFFQGDSLQDKYELPFMSFGLTLNAILSSVGREKEITISNACQEPEIDNTLEFLKDMGVEIEQIEGATIKMRGKKELKGCRFRNMSDRNAAVTYALMGIITNSNLIIENYDDVKMEAFYNFLDEINAKYSVNFKKLSILRNSNNSLNPVKINAFLYPGFHTDWQPLVAPLLTQIEGTSYIEENYFSDRLRYWNELEKMGANFKFDYKSKTQFQDDNPHAVYINGKTSLIGSDVYARDLRGGVALVTASLVAKGTTIIHNAEQILRGYDNLVHILKQLSVNIEIEE